MKPKVAVFNRHASTLYGGAERYSLEVSKALASKYDITYFSQTWDQIPNPIKLHRVPRLTKRRMRWLNQLWFSIYTWWKTKNKFDVIHSHEIVWFADIHTIHCPPVRNKLTKTKSVFRKLFRYVQIMTSLRQLAYFGLERFQFKPQACKNIVAVSQLTLQEIEINYPKSSSMFELILPGIESGLPQNLKASKASLNLKDDEKCLLFVAANNFKIKGLDTLLASISLLDMKVKLTVVGGGDIELYTHKAQKLGIIEKVEFLGFQSNLKDIYTLADVLILPTREDTFSMIVLEAMYAGLPTIISSEKYCGIAAHLSDDEAVKIQNPYDVEEVACLIEGVLSNPQKMLDLSEKGKQFADEHTWEKSAQQFDSLYQRVINCKKNFR